MEIDFAQLKTRILAFLRQKEAPHSVPIAHPARDWKFILLGGATLCALCVVLAGYVYIDAKTQTLQASLANAPTHKPKLSEKELNDVLSLFESRAAEHARYVGADSVAQ